MSVVPVDSSATFVSGTFTRPYLVKNSGKETIYLGQDSSLSVIARAFSLPAGSTLNWSGETELWAITDTGLASELEILYTGENSFTPAPGTVISRLANAPTLLGTFTEIRPVGAGSTARLYPAAGEPLIDVSAFSSIFIGIRIFHGFIPLTPLVGNYIKASIKFSDTVSAGAGIPVQYAPEWLMVTNQGITESSDQSIQVPVKRAYVGLALEMVKGVTVNPVEIEVTVFGTNEVLSEPAYTSQGDGMNGTIPENGIFTVLAPTGDQSYPLATKNSTTFFAYGRQTGANECFLGINAYRAGAIRQLLVASTNVNFLSQVRELKLPMLPIILTSTNGASTVNIGAMQ